jgi:hypothetical protein
MIPLPEPFLSAEIAYRQQRVRELYAAHGRRHHTPRRRHLRMPFVRPRPAVLA